MLKCRHVPILSVRASIFPGPRLAATAEQDETISRITAS